MASIFTLLASLFFTAFLAATIFPAQSEAVLAAMILKTDISVWLLVAVASVGNILGSCVNWLLGRYAESFKDKKWFPIKAVHLQRAQERYIKHGRWLLLLSWVPFIGDPITFAAGMMREKLPIFVAIVGFAKTGRYIIVALLALGIFG